jgi:hypothetical protein
MAPHGDFSAFNGGTVDRHLDFVATALDKHRNSLTRLPDGRLLRPIACRNGKRNLKARAALQETI